MGDKIYVPYQEAESEFVEKRSRFIGHIWPWTARTRPRS